MASVIITMKVMPISPDVNMKELEARVKEKIVEFAGEGEIRTELQPVAFGLKALQVIFVMDESKGATDPLEEAIRSIEEVNSAEVVGVTRALG